MNANFPEYRAFKADRIESLSADNSLASGTLDTWDAGDDDGSIEPRAWLIGNVFCRGFVSSLIAGGGVGKTAVRIAQALSLASGQTLTGEPIFQRCHVLYVSLEDDRDELRRRVRAAMLYHHVGHDDVRGWLFLSTPASQGWKLAVMEDGAPAPAELELRLVETIKKHSIDLIIIDPFVKSHSVEENSNGAIDFVMGILAKIAIEHRCAVDVLHHVRKGALDTGNADNGRGAGSFKDASRLVYTLAQMSPDEAKSFGISEADRRGLVRVDSGKVNIAPPAQTAKWFKLIGVQLGNGTELYPNGDEVQTVEPWTPPDTWAGLSNIMLNAILSEIDNGQPDRQGYSSANAATTLAAWRVVHKHAADKTEGQCREIVRAWVKNGVLIQESYQNPVTRKDAKRLRVDMAKRPS